jgi:hypothetical protein
MMDLRTFGRLTYEEMEMSMVELDEPIAVEAHAMEIETLDTAAAITPPTPS